MTNIVEEVLQNADTMAMARINIHPIKIGDDQFYTVQQFCSIVNKSNQYIYNLINKGNSIRKLKHIKLAQRVLIYASELIEFPFTCVGPGAKDRVYHYSEDGLPNWEELDEPRI